MNSLAANPNIDGRVQEIGRDLFALMEAEPAPWFFSKKSAYSRLAEWSMTDPAFKTQLFRLIDVLPSLHSSAEIVRHIQEYLGDKAVVVSPALKAGLAVASFAPVLIAAPIKAQIADMARQFVAGESADEIVVRLRRNADIGVATTIDLLGEAVVSEREADLFLRRNLEILNTVASAIGRDGQPCFSDIGVDGLLPRLNLSVKISALGPCIQPNDPDSAIAALKKRLRPILRRATEVGALINIDMESHQLKDLTLALFRSILEEAEFREAPAIGIALQAYHRESEADLRELIAWARHLQRPIGVRLVKGAYWDFETVVAQQRQWPVPVWQKKAESDANFEKLSAILLENIDIVTPAFASHNVRSCANAIAIAERLEVDPKVFEFQTLYGMPNELKHALRSSGHRVREYCPFGELLPGMAYLVRRLLENTSNEGFLRRKDTRTATTDQLLISPVAELKALSEPIPLPSPSGGKFFNAANTDFTRAGNRERQRIALEGCVRRVSPLVIGGKQISNRDHLTSVNPANPRQIVGQWARATATDAEAAVLAARTAFPGWARTPIVERARIIERAADLIETRRFELNALEILEAGKPWIEADADVSEAIDFCRFYAMEMRRLGLSTVTQTVPAERCTQMWTPRGVGVVIAPWNFPLAILTGMAVAALVAGNSVILKPAEQTTLVGSELMNILTEAGIPAGVANFVTGNGDEVGAKLVAHSDVDFIAFTGSQAVGLKIWETAGRTHAAQTNLKKVVCEMGGKNAMIIDTDADLDEAVPAAVYSAFGFSGQKCSALSLLIVLDEIHDHFVERFIGATAALPTGDPALPGTVVGPVIDAEAQKRILRLIDEGRREAKLAYQGTVPTMGYFVPPTIFVNVNPNAVIAREEIFGPVVAILRAKDLGQAIAWVNNSKYALTCGLFSRSPSALERVEREVMVGNLYLNRGITGAIVERHPFGGFKMSGCGTKAGGKGYVENFLFARTVAENVMRRGFTPLNDDVGRAAEFEPRVNGSN